MSCKQRPPASAGGRSLFVRSNCPGAGPPGLFFFRTGGPATFTRTFLPVRCALPCAQRSKHHPDRLPGFFPSARAGTGPCLVGCVPDYCRSGKVEQLKRLRPALAEQGSAQAEHGLRAASRPAPGWLCFQLPFGMDCRARPPSTRRHHLATCRTDRLLAPPIPMPLRQLPSDSGCSGQPDPRDGVQGDTARTPAENE